MRTLSKLSYSAGSGKGDECTNPELQHYLDSFDPTIAGVVFLSALAINFLGTKGQISAVERQPIKTGLLDTSVLLLNAITIFSFVNNVLYLGPESLGCFIGSALACRKEVKHE